MTFVSQNLVTSNVVVHQLLVTVYWHSRMGAHAVKLLKQGIGGVAVGIRNEKMVENPILGTAEEGALFSLTADGKIVVNNPHKADIELSDLNKSLS